MGIPKDLAKKCDELADLFWEDFKQADKRMHATSIYKDGFDAGVQAAFSSEHVAGLVGALEKIDKWFNKLKSDQSELFDHGLKEACENWDAFPEATQSIDMTFINEALDKWEKRND